MFRLVLVACAVLFLAACSSGGGGDSGPAAPAVDPDATRSLTGLTPPTFSDDSIQPALNALIGGSDAMVVSDVYVRNSDGEFLAATSCSSRTDCVTDFGDGIRFPFNLRALQGDGFDPNLHYAGVGEKSGVRLFQAQGSTTVVSFPTDSRTYGGWLDHSGFWMRLESLRGGNLGDINLAGTHLGFGTSMGNDTGTRPTGNATWSGIMVGGTDINGAPQAIQGDASLSYDVGQNHLDVAFTNIWNLDTEESFPDKQWADLSVGSDGSFSRETSSTDIKGRFYGPEHAEVGGTFIEPQSSGAFGAKRQ